MSEIEITSELLAELRRKSEAIEAKCRVWEYDKYSMEVVTEGGIYNVASTYNCEREGQFIAVANPAVVLALVAEIERLRAELVDRPIVWAIQNINTKKLSARDGQVYLHNSKEHAEEDIQSCFFEPLLWKAVVYTGRQQ